MDAIHALVGRLAQHVTPADGFNPYHDATRRANLTRYLMQMHARSPEALMLMEAPGYRGCRLTGIPVTSRKVMLEGVPSLGLFGEGYADARDEGYDDIYGEQSATIVWATLADIGRAPLLWNAYPFHPHQMGAPRTNRRPRRRDELDTATPYLQTMLDIFAPREVIAVGNVAHETLGRMGIKSAKVRHPAQGGKGDFVAGLSTLLGGLDA